MCAAPGAEICIQYWKVQFSPQSQKNLPTTTELCAPIQPYSFNFYTKLAHIPPTFAYVFMQLIHAPFHRLGMSRGGIANNLIGSRLEPHTFGGLSQPKKPRLFSFKKIFFYFSPVKIGFGKDPRPGLMQQSFA